MWNEHGPNQLSREKDRYENQAVFFGTEKKLQIKSMSKNKEFIIRQYTECFIKNSLILKFNDLLIILWKKYKGFLIYKNKI